VNIQQIEQAYGTYNNKIYNIAISMIKGINYGIIIQTKIKIYIVQYVLQL